MTIPAFIRAEPDGVILAIKLQPRASAETIGESVGEELRIKVTAPPVDSRANEALVKLLAKQLNWPRNQMRLVKGGASRHKLVKVHGITVQELMRRLDFRLCEKRRRA